MRLKEAIDELDGYLTGVPMDYRHKFWDSVRLGFEAMKAVKLERETYAFERIDTLPSETKEAK